MPAFRIGSPRQRRQFDQWEDPRDSRDLFGIEPSSSEGSLGDAFKGLQQAALENWKATLPRTEAGSPMDHGGGLGLIPGFVQGRGFAFGDSEKGERVSVGPGGFSLSRRGESMPPGTGTGERGFALQVGPSSASIGSGDFQIGGNWGKSPSAFIEAGPVRASGGYGVAPVAALMGDNHDLAGPGKPGAWGMLEYQSRPSAPPSWSPASAVERAVRPYEESAPAEPRGETPGEFLDKQLRGLDDRDPGWRKRWGLRLSP